MAKSTNPINDSDDTDLINEVQERLQLDVDKLLEYSSNNTVYSYLVLTTGDGHYYKSYGYTPSQVNDLITYLELTLSALKLQLIIDGYAGKEPVIQKINNQELTKTNLGTGISSGITQDQIERLASEQIEGLRAGDLKWKH